MIAKKNSVGKRNYAMGASEQRLGRHDIPIFSKKYFNSYSTDIMVPGKYNKAAEMLCSDIMDLDNKLIYYFIGLYIRYNIVTYNKQLRQFPNISHTTIGQRTPLAFNCYE